MAARLRILSVDDDKDICHLLKLALQDEYDIYTCSNGKDALEIMDTLEPDVFIIDVMMGRESGFDIADKIKAHNIFKFAPLIFLTCKGDTESIKEGYKRGAVDFEIKPITMERFNKNLKVILEKHPPPVYKKRYTFSEIKRRESLTPQPKVMNFSFEKEAVEKPIIKPQPIVYKEEDDPPAPKYVPYAKQNKSPVQKNNIPVQPKQPLPAEPKPYIKPSIPTNTARISNQPIVPKQADIPANGKRNGLPAHTEGELNEIKQNFPEIRLLVLTSNKEIKNYITKAIGDLCEYIFLQPTKLTMEFIEIAQPDIIIHSPIGMMAAGIEIVKDIKSNIHYPNLPLIFLDLKETTFSAQEVYASKADIYLTTGLNEYNFLKNIKLFISKTGSNPSRKKHTFAQIKNVAELREAENISGSHQDIKSYLSSEKWGIDRSVPPITEIPESKTAESEKPITPTQTISKPIKQKFSENTPYESTVQTKFSVSGEKPEEARYRLFIIDDDADSVKEFYDALYYQGHELVYFLECAQAIKYIKSFDPDILIVEVNMHDMDGLKFCKTIKTNPLLEKFPVILFSKKSYDKYRDKALKYGATDFITKNKGVNEFAAIINDILKFALKNPEKKKVPFKNIATTIRKRVLPKEFLKTKEVVDLEEKEQNGDEKKTSWLD